MPHRVFRMGHQAEYIARLVHDARDVRRSAVRIGVVRDLAFGVAVAEYDLIIVLQAFQGVLIGEIAALAGYLRNMRVE